jgi:hypothetical protein
MPNSRTSDWLGDSGSRPWCSAETAMAAAVGSPWGVVVASASVVLVVSALAVAGMVAGVSGVSAWAAAPLSAPLNARAVASAVRRRGGRRVRMGTLQSLATSGERALSMGGEL